MTIGDRVKSFCSDKMLLDLVQNTIASSCVVVVQTSVNFPHFTLLAIRLIEVYNNLLLFNLDGD